MHGEATDTLIYSAVFGTDSVRPAARWIIWTTAQAVGIYPASIHELYMAAGRGEYGNATTPAINVRGMSYDFARTIIRTGQKVNTKNFIFEIARSEMGYTEQTPDEFAHGDARRRSARGPSRPGLHPGRSPADQPEALQGVTRSAS